MSLYELEIGWARTANERCYLQWELLASDEVLGVFPTSQENTVALLFDGEPWEFRAWASTVGPEVAA